MTNGGWTFWVHLIREGERTGLLLQKQALPNGEIEAKYFYSNTPDGLAPDDHILRACNYSYAKLAPRNDERIVIRLLASCAEFVARQDGHTDTIPLGLVHDTEQQYPTDISRLFEGSTDNHRNEDSELRKFLIDRNVFSRFVLEKKHAVDVLVVKAKEFGVLSPATIALRDDPHYLRSTDDILRVGDSLTPRWFRKEGPVKADLDADCVFRREDKIAQLRDLIDKHHVVMLEGLSATGKSVIVRTLINDLRSSTSARYFSCDEDRNFDHVRLLDEIRAACGLVIIEDIHLAADRIQFICARLNEHNHPRVLFTSRPSFRQGQRSRYKDIAELPTLHLEPFDDVDNIMDKFLDGQSCPDMSSEARSNIKKVCAQSFWLLAYALPGYVYGNGQGTASEWLADSVMRDLGELGSLDEPNSSKYPEILVALSRLYRNEVPTAQSYLIRSLGFPKEVIDALVARGEVMKQSTPDHGVLLGLPHSGLGQAYWEHGKEYKSYMNLPALADFLYDYASPGVPNGLEAIRSADDEPGDKAVARLVHDGHMSNVIASETSLSEIASFIRNSRVSGVDALVPAVADRIHSSAYLSGVSWCVDAAFRADRTMGEHLWTLLNKKELARGLAEFGDLRELHMVRFFLDMWDPRFWEELCAAFEPRVLAKAIISAESIPMMLLTLSNIAKSNEEVTLQVCEHIPTAELAAAINVESSVLGIGGIIKLMFTADEQRGWQVWNQLDRTGLARKIMSSSNLPAMGETVSEILCSNDEVAEQLWTELDLAAIARTLNSSQDLDAVIACASVVCAGHDEYGNELLALLTNRDVKGKVEQFMCKWRQSESERSS